MRALAEIVVVRRRRLVVGQIENADIDRGNDDLGVLAGVKPAELDRQLQASSSGAPAPAATGRPASVRAFLSMPNHFRPMARPGIRCGGGIERPAQGRHHIGAGAPILADRES